MERPRRWLATLLVLWIAVSVREARADALPDRTDRLVAVARVWSKAKFFHPYLAYKDIDWDAALIAAIPKVEAATTLAQYRAAVAELLGKLGDPLTRVTDAKPTTQATPPAGDWLTTQPQGILIVDLGGFVAGGFDFVAFRTKGQQVAAAAAKAKVVVIDLRTSGEPWLPTRAVNMFADALPAIDDWPLERIVEHRGYRTQDGQSSGGYYSTFVTEGALPPKPAPKTGPVHVVFVADPQTYLPPSALALQAAGRATIIASGPLAEDAFVTTMNVPLGGGLDVQLRLGELLWGPPTADLRVPAAELRARAIAQAKALAAKPAVAKPRKLLSLPPLRPRNDLDYADQPYPSRPLRMLAGIRIWAILEHFFPYRYLIADWELVLRQTLPRLEAAADRDAYFDVLREMGALAGDGHIGIRYAEWKPRAIPSFAVRLVEKKLVIMQLLDPAEAKQHALAVGDVIEAIDGKPAATLLAERRRLMSGSTDEARDQRTAGALFGGDDGTPLKLALRGANGKLRDVTVIRRLAHGAVPPPTTPHWKTLAGNVGYVDLMQLTVPEVGPMFAALEKTRAIVFDMRGYPQGTAWSIAPRVNTRKAKYGAQFLMPLVAGEEGDARSDRRIRFLQGIPPLPPGAPIYTGKIVVLIDDRAISQSEHTCLFLQETAGATFVGSPTHGANGDVTVARLPGGLRMSLTGQEVRHVDGKQLQKIGIQPHLTIRPSVAGVRAGKDEVLDRALVWLDKGK